MNDNKQLKPSAKRLPPAAGKGRIKGSKNKNTRAIKDMIEGALADAGGREYLARQAEENPAAFMTLIGKILPKDINVGGQADNPIITTVKLVAMQNGSDDTTT